jgi:hypothetical protein
MMVVHHRNPKATTAHVAKIFPHPIHLGRFPRLIVIVAAAGIGLGLAHIGALPANAAVTDWSVVATITVGSQPSGVALTPDGTHAYIVNNGTDLVGSRGDSGAGGLGQSHHVCWRSPQRPVRRT